MRIGIWDRPSLLVFGEEGPDCPIWFVCLKSIVELVYGAAALKAYGQAREKDVERCRRLLLLYTNAI